MLLFYRMDSEQEHKFTKIFKKKHKITALYILMDIVLKTNLISNSISFTKNYTTQNQKDLI
jgi:hypothetical protein